jgi:hypothetical protein
MLVSRISYLATSLTLIASLTLSNASAAPNFTVNPKDKLEVKKDNWTGFVNAPKDNNEIADVFMREVDGASLLSHLGIYVENGRMFEMNNDTAARQWRAAGRPSNLNLLETTPDRFESTTRMQGVRALAATGERLVEKVRAVSIAKETMIAGATFTNWMFYTAATVGEPTCRTVVLTAASPRSGGSSSPPILRVVCNSHITVGDYRCDTYVANIYDRATNTTAFSGIYRSGRVVFSRIPFLK